MTRATTGQGRRGMLPTALAGLAVLAGFGALGAGALNQQPDPPSVTAAATTSTPDASAESAEADGTGAPQGPDDASSSTGATATANDLADARDDEPDDTAEPAALPPSEPVQVRIPAIDVTSPLHALGLAEDGTLAVPSGERIDEAAWYDGSPTPGETGPTVIEGHVTSVGGRASIFFELAALEAGDTAEVEREDGKVVTYEVYRVDQFAKSDFPTVDVYGPTPGPELRLITCGGEFDESSGHHLDNTVVYARMIEP